MCRSDIFCDHTPFTTLPTIVAPHPLRDASIVLVTLDVTAYYWLLFAVLILFIHVNFCIVLSKVLQNKVQNYYLVSSRKADMLEF